jgi:hypothetical protein
MRPDQRWFPTNRVERAAWFSNFAANFARNGISLGFTQAEIDGVAADNAIVQFAARTVNELEAYISAVKSYQRTITLGNIGTAAATFPAPPSINVPPAVPNGIFERLERLVRRIRTQPAYTPAAGELLGIVPAKPDRASLAQVKPSIKILPAAGPYSFTVKTVRRHFKGFCVEGKRGSSAEWEVLGFFVGSPAVIRIDPAVFGQPEMLEVRVRAFEGNKPGPNASDIKVVTVTP